MKTYKIERLQIQNFRAIENLTLELQGQNAIISGQNGAGKSSIVDAVGWLFQNRLQYEPVGAENLITAVEADFGGLKLRKETRGSKSAFAVNGLRCNATDFKVQIGALFGQALPVLFAPLSFGQMHYSEQRRILIAAFAKELSTFDAEQTIQQVRAQLKTLDRDLNSIPARIAELSSQIKPYDVEKIKLEIAAAESKVKSSDRAKFDAELLKLRDQFRANEGEIKRLRGDYQQLKKAQSGTCPLCGSKIPPRAQFQKKIEQIANWGKHLSKQQEELKATAQSLKAELEKMPSAAESAELDARILDLKLQLAEAKRAAELEKRIAELKAEEIKKGELKTSCDRQIYEAEQQIRARITQLEAAVNQHFSVVQFKMFQPFKAAEGVKECCEPYVGKVPYAYLSKGEKLKAALDILKALQEKYQIQLPLFIDDAESYTSNSFVELPNQIIRLIAAEGIEKLEVII